MVRLRVTEDTKVSRKENILSSNIDSEVVLLNITKGEYNGLNEVGTDIWNELVSPQRIEDLVSKLVEVYKIEKQQCTVEVIEFVKELIDSGLVEIVNDQK